MTTTGDLRSSTGPPRGGAGGAERQPSPPASAAEVLALEAVGARSWPALETAQDDDWLLRASAGWTRRANSAVPLRELPAPGRSIDRIERWYAARGLPPTVAVPLPLMSWLARDLSERGWSPGVDVDVMVAPVDVVTSGLAPRTDLPGVEVAAEPSDEWLAIYRGGTLPQHAVGILRGADARFVGLRLDGDLVGIVRSTVEAPWVGLAAMEVTPVHRGRGFALHLLRGALEQAAAAGAERAWLQVEPTNTAGQGLYRRAGFTVHHAYRYYQLAQDGDPT